MIHLFLASYIKKKILYNIYSLAKKNVYFALGKTKENTWLAETEKKKKTTKKINYGKMLALDVYRLVTSDQNRSMSAIV